MRQKIAKEFGYGEPGASSNEGEEEEDDPLEAFMAGIEVCVCVCVCVSIYLQWSLLQGTLSAWDEFLKVILFSDLQMCYGNGCCPLFRTGLYLRGGGGGAFAPPCVILSPLASVGCSTSHKLRPPSFVCTQNFPPLEKISAYSPAEATPVFNYNLLMWPDLLFGVA